MIISFFIYGKKTIVMIVAKTDLHATACEGNPGSVTPALKTQRKSKRLRNLTSKHDVCKFSKAVGQRLKEARELCCMNQKEAAVRLGYETSSKLSKIEGGASAEPSAMLLRDASLLYDVSVDYLLGITASTSTSDADSRLRYRELTAHLFADFDKRHAQDILAIENVVNSITEIKNLLSLADKQLASIDTEINRIKSLPEWLEVRGGNRLINRVDALSGTIKTAVRKYNITRAGMVSSTGLNLQLDLLLEV